MVCAIRVVENSRDGTLQLMCLCVGRSAELSVAQIFNGRKTEQCGVILFGTEGATSSAFVLNLPDGLTGTSNIINEKNGGYERVSEYIPIGQPNNGTLAKLQALQASEESGDRRR